MNGENINISGPGILVSPLDWGLGHATRCIPVIRELLRQGAEVYIGCGKNAKKILYQEFPHATFLEIPDYNITYSKGKDHWLRLLLQVPKAFSVYKQEHRLLNKYVRQYRIKAVISDNRFGLWNKGIHSVYITHQLQFITGNKFTSSLLRSGHSRVMDHFNEIWVPDDPQHTLSGELSHGRNAKFCGPLSRIERKENEKDIEWLLLISGPEPQRSIFEKKLLQIFSGNNAVMVRGINSENILEAHSLKEVYNLADRDLLQDLISRAKTVVCRSGYSTIMDLGASGSSAVLVPTPGQPEQEYLASLHAPNGIGMVSQDDLSFESLSRASIKIPSVRNEWLKDRVAELLSVLR